MGRFLQADPNGMGQPLLDDIAFHGRPFRPMVFAPNLRRAYVNGVNRYEYLGSNPLIRSDPFGLEFSLVGTLKAGGWGAAIGGTSNAAIARLYKGESWQDTFIAGGKGAFAGFVGGSIGYSFGAAAAWAGFEGYGVMVLGSGLGGAGSGATSGLLNGESAGAIGRDALWGGGLGLFSGLIGTGVLSRNDASTPVRQQMAEVLDWLNQEFFDVYFSSAMSGFGAMADEVRRP